MKKQLLRMMLVAVAMVFGASGVWADELTATLTHTASSSCAGDASAYTSTLDAEKEHVNNSAFNSTWQGAAYADFSFAIPEGSSVTKATLTFHIFGESRRDRDCGIYYVNAGEQLDYEAIAAGNAKVNLPATQIGNVTFNRSGDNVEKTQDVTEAVKAIVAAGQSNIIFKWTGNPGGGDVAGKGLETAPVLVIETASAASQTKYTIKFVDEANNKIKDDVVYDGTIGQEAVIPAEDKANFYSEDGLKKYIFVSGETITLVADEASNVITLTFREAAIYKYIVNFVAGESILGSKTGETFEGDGATVAYPKYLALEGQLYTKDATDKEYNYKFTPEADGEVKALEYTAVEGVDNVVFLTEGEYVEDLTPCTTANTGVRSSNSASAYAATDTKIAVLTPGTYKLHAIIYDASKTPDSHFIFKAGENQIADFNCTVINIQEFDSEEFTVEETCHLILTAVGSASIGLDALYITGDGKATAFENTYTLVGNCTAIFGTEWDVNNSANDMVKGENGIYTKTYEGISLTNDYVVEYKVVKNNSYDNGQWPYEGNQNYKVWEGDGVYNVTFTFDLANNAVSCDMQKQQQQAEPIVATFNFADPNFRNPVGTATTDVAGYIYNETFTTEGISLQITAGSAPSRIYVDANRGQNLVTYKEYTTLTFRAPEGKAITKIEFTAAGNSNINNLTASSGEIEGMVWTGNAAGVRFLQGGTSYLANAIVTLEAAGEATAALPAIEYTECANIAAFNALEAGTYAKITLTDAEVIGKSADGYSTVWVQDATGGAWIQYTSLNDRLQEGTKVNGTVFTIKRFTSGNPQLKEAEATINSEIASEAISSYTVVEGTIEEVNVAENLNKVVKISGATLAMTSASAGKLTQSESTIDVNNGTETANMQLHKIADWEKDKVLENITITAILVAKSATANQLLPISIDQPVVINSMAIVGDFIGLEGDENWNPANGWQMEQSVENPAIWTLTKEFEAEAKKYEYKATANGNWSDYVLPAGDNQNFEFGTEGYPAGKYNLTFTANTEDHTLSLDVEAVITKTCKAYFVNTQDWEKVYAWVWNTTGNLYESWPGTEIEKTGNQKDGHDVYVWSYTGEFVPTMIIFNNGSNIHQTADLEFVNGATYDAAGNITTGISTISVAAQQGQVFNMAGQRVMNAQKGLYIVNGKKVVK